MSSSTDQTAKTTRHERILGVDFFNGNAAQAVEHLRRTGGYIVAPAAPALINLKYDQDYRRALQGADLALADSRLVSFIHRLISGRPLEKVSGLAYLKCFLKHERFAHSKGLLWVLPSESARSKALEWLQLQGLPADATSLYVFPREASIDENHRLLLQLEQFKPNDIVIALGAGAQEKLGLYLRDYLLYRPRIHCVGAAFGFLIGQERGIPEWADRHSLGWLVRLFSQPRMLLPRTWIVLELATMIFMYGSELPPLQTRWADV